MKTWLLSPVLLSLCVLAVDSHAQAGLDGEGRVVVVDVAKGTMTLDHGPISDLMPAGRTEFSVEQAHLLRTVRAGDAVRFSLVIDPESHGRLSLSSLTATPASGDGRPFGGVRLADALPWAALLLSMALLIVVWREGHHLRHALRDARKDFLNSWSRQEDIHQDLRAVVHALAEIARTVGDRYRRDLGRRIAAVQGASGMNVVEDGAASIGPRRLCIVRHGRTDLFRTLQQCLEEPGFTQVLWDRRSGDRRTGPGMSSPERRRGERRTAAPATWDAHGFALAPQHRRTDKRRPERPGDVRTSWRS